MKKLTFAILIIAAQSALASETPATQEQLNSLVGHYQVDSSSLKCVDEEGLSSLSTHLYFDNLNVVDFYTSADGSTCTNFQRDFNMKEWCLTNYNKTGEYYGGSGSWSESQTVVHSSDEFGYVRAAVDFRDYIAQNVNDLTVKVGKAGEAINIKLYQSKHDSSNGAFRQATCDVNLKKIN